MMSATSLRSNAPPSGLVIAGLTGGSGKTVVTCVLLAGLRDRGVNVQPFKVGPDFIDAAYHGRYSERPSRNLDRWLMGIDGIRDEAAAGCSDRIGIAEGMMGLFDGCDVDSDRCSALDVARILDWPVVLVLPGGPMAGRSLAAALSGFVREAGQGRILGWIANRVANDGHRDYLLKALDHLDLKPLGALPERPELAWPERHLGLQASQERELPPPRLLSRLAEKHLDLESILALIEPGALAPSPKSKTVRKKIALARDGAFHFYYSANLEFLRSMGADLIPFSPLRDSALPSGTEGLIFGGGFPEIFASELASNEPMKSAVRRAVRAGMPCYAECGGLMYLCESLLTSAGNRFPMVGLVPGRVAMSDRLHNFGYCTARPNSASEDDEKAVLPGQEFHYSQWLDEGAEANLWEVVTHAGGARRREGYTWKNLHASYLHLHWSKCRRLILPLLGIEE